MFNVYNIIERKSKVMNFKEVCLTYPDARLMLLKEKSISIVSVYNGGNKIAVINRIKEGKGVD